MRRRWGLVVLLGAALSTQACSILFTDGPPPRHEQRAELDCSSTYAVPVADTAISVLGLGFLAIGGTGSSGGLSSERNLVILGAAGAFAVSALVGYQTVYDCREAMDEAASAPPPPRRHAAPPSPRAGAPAPQPPPPPALQPPAPEAPSPSPPPEAPPAADAGAP